VSTNTDEFLAVLEGKPFDAADVDSTVAAEVAGQVETSVEDFIIKQLKSALTPEQFEHFVAELLRCMGYYARVTPHKGDGGVDIIAHKSLTRNRRGCSRACQAS
jgi:restriction system protein